ncbi:hypothetical protein LS482_01530 [Sinomicrobium kalidii]|uniref:hypothetical protein n=1 Tax=Sinomicrobium kalidii TaxID=2900738 RepID=UPI001E40ABA9|nr:hypothetical protein [Sinomicrobium kalidii]UGU16562.1 hypothetical protein LS482_01530 [Sinomicrobium kalidii]
MKTLESYGVHEMNVGELRETNGGISFDQAYNDFQQGGAHLGLGAAMLVSAAWTGIALTPALILGSLGAGGLLGGGLDL